MTIPSFDAAFHVRGIPKPQPRPRASAYKDGEGKWHARVHDAGTAEAWKGDVIREARPFRPAVPLAGPIFVEIRFYLPRPQSLMRKKDPSEAIPHARKRDDIDNLAKAVLDALVTDGWMEDDGQVYGLHATKYFAAKDYAPGAWIYVTQNSDLR